MIFDIINMKLNRLAIINSNWILLIKMVLAYFDIETKNDWFCLIWLTPWQLKSPPVKGGMEKAATSNCCPWPENSECVVFAMANWLNPCRQNIYQSRSFHFIHSPSSSPLFTSSKFSASLSLFAFHELEILRFAIIVYLL